MAPSARTYPSPLRSSQRCLAPSSARVCSTWIEPRSRTTSSARYARSMPAQRMPSHAPSSVPTCPLNWLMPLPWLLTYDRRRLGRRRAKLEWGRAGLISLVITLAPIRTGALRHLGGAECHDRPQVGHDGRTSLGDLVARMQHRSSLGLGA